jgi:hypothetical protein
MLIMHVTSLLKGRKKSQVLRGTITNSDIKHGPDNTWSTKVFVNKMNTLGKVTTKQVPRQTQNQHLSPCALTSGQATSVLILQWRDRQIDRQQPATQSLHREFCAWFSRETCTTCVHYYS